MKKRLWIITALVMAGCSYQGEDVRNYLENPPSLIKDPHFSEHQRKLDEL